MHNLYRFQINTFPIMKTILIAIFSILVLGTSNAKPIRDIISIKDPALQTEEYVDDIPFNTELIASESLMMNSALAMDEEVYVDDIPFDTRSIACKALLCQMISNTIEEEANDIPFDTRKIYEECMLARMTKDFGTEQEASDIQFDTWWIANNSLLAGAVKEYRDEAEVHDVPYQTVCIISSSYMNEPAYIVVKKKAQRKIQTNKGRMEDYEYTIFQPCCIEVPTPVPVHNTLTREILVMPGSSL